MRWYCVIFRQPEGGRRWSKETSAANVEQAINKAQLFLLDNEAMDDAAEVEAVLPV